ncbi:SLBB domain-containing protein [Pedobacter sp. AW31-3R]|uniref:SLBB domain-containing protein n=1 Tax=Pedobacter sp. AW31-3R TaxID=3445781 RepID=UPI003FA0092D
MLYKNILPLFALLLLLFFTDTVCAQTNYANVKVDELTDVQIKSMMQRAESMGYTDAQLEQMAQAQGMKITEIEKLRMRVEGIRANNVSNGTASSVSSSGKVTDKGNVTQNGRTYPGDTVMNKSQGVADINPKIFGAELFANNNLKFEPNMRMATPRGYIIGPDDELLIDLTGDNEANYRLKVSPDGNVRIEYVGLVAVNGLSVEQASAKVKSAMSRIYPGLKNGRSQVAVNLGNIRSIKVTVVGNAIKPGTYTLSSLSNLFNVLYACGGPSENGSFRNIQLIRNNKVVSTLDVYDFLLKGMQSANIRLQDQDVINVPVYVTRVEMKGEVKRPAFFEVTSRETLQDVIGFAGGFSNKAYTARIKVLQNTNKERRITDISAEEFEKYSPLNGDTYVVEEILNRYTNRVEINGAVFRPGEYALTDGLTLKQLIEKAEGLKEDAFLNRGYISRLNADNTLSLLSFELDKVLNGAQQDIVLRREDKVSISSIFDLRDEYKVDIKGEVRAPGTFTYAEGMTLEALIQMAGGFKEGATPDRVEIARRIKDSDAQSVTARTAEVFNVKVSPSLKLQDSVFILKPFDIVSIRNAEGYLLQQQVRVEGEVLYPGIYTITNKNERISDVVKRAGGLTALSFAEGASLKRPGSESLSDTGSLSKSVQEKREDERQKMANLKRLQGAGVQDTAQLVEDARILGSDLVGIDLIRILKKPGSRADLLLEDGDVIRVPKQLQTVRITGEVLRPINVVYDTRRSMKQYINGAGGFTYNANRKGTYIQYANGSVDATRKFLFFNVYPQVKPGAEVFVPKRAPREKIGLSGLVGISSALATLAAVLISVF